MRVPATCLCARHGPLKFAKHDVTGAGALPESVLLKEDLARFYAFCTEEGRLDRDGPPLSKGTVAGYLSSVNMFIGFLQKFMGIKEMHWSLALFSNQYFVAAYAAFKAQASKASVRRFTACNS